MRTRLQIEENIEHTSVPMEEAAEILSLEVLLDIRELLSKRDAGNGSTGYSVPSCTCGRTNALCPVHASYGIPHGQ